VNVGKRLREREKQKKTHDKWWVVRKRDYQCSKRYSTHGMRARGSAVRNISGLGRSIGKKSDLLGLRNLVVVLHEQMLQRLQDRYRQLLV
jgi:hypothetical protein